MSDKKLTPRVGDRVLVISGFDSRVPHSKCGWVTGFSTFGGPLVDIDGLSERIMVPFPHIEVLDREPVEWPEGWVAYDEGKDGFVEFFCNGIGRSDSWVFDRDQLKALLSTGPDMLARWNELMGGDA